MGGFGENFFKPEILVGKEKLSEVEQKIVDELRGVYDGNSKALENVLKNKENPDKVLASIKKEIPEIEPDSSENFLNMFIKSEGLEKDSGLVISPAIEKVNETHIQREKARETARRPLKIRLDLEGAKEPPEYMAAKNPVGCDLTIRGNCGNNFGYGMRGGVVKVEGDVGEKTAKGMRGGELYFFGDVGGFAPSAFDKKRNKGKIFQMEKTKTGKEKLVQIYPKAEKEKQEK